MKKTGRRKAVTFGRSPQLNLCIHRHRHNRHMRKSQRRQFEGKAGRENEEGRQGMVGHPAAGEVGVTQP
jgi:hypothetical protein